LISWSATLGAYIWDGPEAVLNQHIFKVTSKINQQFHYHLVRDKIAELERNAHGSGMVHVTKGIFDATPVAVPNPREQERLAEFLDMMEAKQESAVEHLVDARRAVERFRQAVLAAACSGRLTEVWRDSQPTTVAFDKLVEVAQERRRHELGRRFHEPELNVYTDFANLPTPWTLVPLGLLLQEIKYGTSKRSDYGLGGNAVLRIPNVSGSRLDLADLKFADLPSHEAVGLALQQGDLLMIRSNGSVQLVGKTVAVTDEAVGMAYAGYLMRLRPDTSLVLPQYLCLALASPALRRQIEMPARSTSGVHNINTDEVRGLGVPIPPLDEQDEIVLRALPTLRLADTLSGRIDQATQSISQGSQGILAKAFSGGFSEYRP
jgi:type I restriction enzyme S subunit